jgi:hypothetical protein
MVSMYVFQYPNRRQFTCIAYSREASFYEEANRHGLNRHKAGKRVYEHS